MARIAVASGMSVGFALCPLAAGAAVGARFFRLVDGSRAYATGGSTHNELWGRPAELGHTLGVEAAVIGKQKDEVEVDLLAAKPALDEAGQSLDV